MNYTNLPYPIFLTISPTICQIKSLSLHFFSFQKVSFLSFTKQTFVVQTMLFHAKLLSHYVFQSHTVMKVSNMLLQFCTMQFVLR